MEWKEYNNIGVARRSFETMIRGDGYQVRQFTPDVGRGDNFFASTRCQPIGAPEGYEDPQDAMDFCVMHAYQDYDGPWHSIDDEGNVVLQTR